MSAPQTPTRLPTAAGYSSFKQLLQSPTDFPNSGFLPHGQQTPKQPASKLAASEDDSRLGTIKLACLVASLLGAQLMWTIEFGYGTPFLLSMGLSKQVASLVWLAAPMTGLLGQPIIGALSDAAPPRYRRRKFIAYSTATAGIFALLAAYSKSMASLLVDVFSQLEDWEPAKGDYIRVVAIWVAIPAFWGLDFSLNALQAASRALILDTARSDQQSAANAWQGRVTHIGNLAGYGLGFTDLGHARVLSWIPGGQFARLVLLAVILLAGFSYLTCSSISEGGISGEESGISIDETGENEGLRVLRNIKQSIIDLPTPVRRVCYVQFFAWLGWFPFLFFGTTFIAEQYVASHPSSSVDSAAAVRMGSLAMLFYSLVSLLAGIVLPYIYELGSSDYILSRSSSWDPIRHLLQRYTLRDLWTCSHFFFGACMLSTFATSGHQTPAIWSIALVGVCWATTCWIPFAFVMQMIREMEGVDGNRHDDDDEVSIDSNAASIVDSIDIAASRSYGRTRAEAALSECSPLVPDRRAKARPGVKSRESRRSYAGARNNGNRKRKTSGATILGIHNLAIVAPQFITSLVSSAIFKLVSADSATNLFRDLSVHSFKEALAVQPPKKDVVYVFLFGALAAFAAGVASLFVPPTREELLYVKDLQDSCD